jgi:hypothetical protein
LILEGIGVPGASEHWGHDFVQGQFVGQLINRRKLYPTSLRPTLEQNYRLREVADYRRRDHVTEVRAAHRRASGDLRGGSMPTRRAIHMSKEHPLQLDERTQQAVDELKDTITQHYPTATFELARAMDDPQCIHLFTVVDVDDPDEVGDLVIERIVALQADEQIPIHVIPLRTPERVRAELHAQHGRRRAVPLLGRLLQRL